MTATILFHGGDLSQWLLLGFIFVVLPIVVLIGLAFWLGPGRRSRKNNSR